MEKYPFFFLKTCDKCQDILKQIPHAGLDLINIKETPLNEEQLDRLKNMAGSFQALFNFRAQKLKGLEAKDKPTTEDDFKKLLLEDYTYLKRPVAVLKDEIFVGHAPDIISKLQIALKK